LIVLWRYNLLSNIQIDKLVATLWKFRNSNGFPQRTENILYYSAFLWFPHPNDLDTKELLRDYFSKTDFLVQSPSTESGVRITHGENIFAGNLTGTFNANAHYAWSSEDLSNLFGRIINWWDSDKHYLKEEHLCDEFQARFNNMISIFACVFQPNINSFDKKYSSQIEKILSELRDHNVPDYMARASFIKIFPTRLKDLIEDICSALISKNEKIIPDVIGATIVLLRQECDGIDTVLKIISENIKYRIEVGMARFLPVINEIIRYYPDRITVELLSNIEYGLSHLIIETVVADDDTEKEVHTKLICRKKSAALAAILKNYYSRNKNETPQCIEEWEKIALNPNEISEVRNAWKNSCIKLKNSSI
jgi:hypothetical protein